MNRSIELLEPVTQEKVRRLIAAAAAVGMEVYVVTAYRTYDEQDKLFAQGRTTPGNKVTNAEAGQSWHNFARAVDLAFEDVYGKPVWDEAQKGDWQLLGLMGERMGLTWGGRIEGLGDYGHFAWQGGMTREQARASWEAERGSDK